MRYFVIASITFHAALFVAWPADNDSDQNSSQTGNTPALALVINKDSTSPHATRHHKPLKRHPGNIQSDTSEVIERTTQAPMPSTTAVQADGVDNTVTNQTGSSDESQIAQALPQPLSGPQIQTRLRDAFIPYFNYPKLAREKGWQGTVELMVNIDTQGQLTQVRLLRSSGYGILDRAAITSLNQVRTLPAIRQWLDNYGLELVFPVKYQLIDT